MNEKRSGLMDENGNGNGGNPRRQRVILWYVGQRREGVFEELHSLLAPYTEDGVEVVWVICPFGVTPARIRTIIACLTRDADAVVIAGPRAGHGVAAALKEPTDPPALLLDYFENLGKSERDALKRALIVLSLNNPRLSVHLHLMQDAEVHPEAY